MAFDKFLIAPLNSGLQTNLRPWLIMDDAFVQLQNVYQFRGRIRKRFGSLLMGSGVLTSRLRIALSGGAGVGITDGAGNATGTVPGNVFAVGQMFSIGTEIYTVYNPAAGANPMLDTGATVTKTYNLATGVYNFAGAPAGTQIYFYPSTPVMGISQYESGAINNHPTYAFDTQFAYLFTPASGWNRSGTGVWHGSDTNFFWTTNWQGSTTLSATGKPVFFATNFQVTNYNGAGNANDDPIWYTADGSTWTSVSGANGFYFLPNGGAVHSGPFVQTARIIVPFKNRLVLLNTVENDNSGGLGVNSNYVNRARFCWNGSPFAVNAWYEPNQQDASGNTAAGASYEDAATEEQIISAEFVKDRLIVYFERSTWELAYTGNEMRPFVWQKLNTELGSQSTFSTVPFDKDVLTIGNTGIHACNGSNVLRVDDAIPDEIFNFKTKNNATVRTCGIRDYITELVYWAFAVDNETTTQIYPNQVLVYNYKNGTWALNDDCFTAFGYFEQQTDVTWASSAPDKWGQFNSTWVSGVQAANRRQILAGNPEGFVVRLVPDEVSRNAPTLQITNLTVAATGIVTLTIINHNLSISGEAFGFPDYIWIENIASDGTIDVYLNGTIYAVNSIVDANTITIDTNRTNPLTGLPQVPLTSGTYKGAGTVARVSNTQILTKQYNPYDKQGRNVYVARIDFAVQKTANGVITVDYFPSATDVSMIQGGIASQSIMGTSVLETTPYNATYYPLEQFQQRLWHPVYFQSSGECIQMALYLSPLQIANPNVADEDFELEGMTLYTQPVDSRMQ